MKRTLILIGVLAFVVGLAFLVARPSTDRDVVAPYVGARGASRVKASGLAISLRRGVETRTLAPGTLLRAGDVLRFAVRVEHARYLLVRMRDGARSATTIFPAPEAVGAVLVQPKQALPDAPPLGPSAGKVVVTAVFADHAFTLDGARGADVEEIDAVMEKEAAAP